MFTSTIGFGLMIKLFFWQSELGSNLVQGNLKVGVRRSLAVTSSQEKKSNNNYRGSNYRNRSENNYEGNASCSERSGCIFVGSRACFFLRL